MWEEKMPQKKAATYASNFLLGKTNHNQESIQKEEHTRSWLRKGNYPSLHQGVGVKKAYMGQETA